VFRLLIAFLGTLLFASDPAFTIVVKTDNTQSGSSASNAFILPLAPSATYSFTVDWGDTTSDVVTTAVDQLHVYPAPGTYAIRITENVVGGFPRVFCNSYRDGQKWMQITNWGDVTWSSMAGAFSGCERMNIIAPDAATARTSGVTDFSAAWSGCSSLTSFPLLNTSAGTNFSGAWFKCSSLTSFPLLNTSAGTNFSAAWSSCSGLTSFPLLNTSAGTDFSRTWSCCSGLTSFPLLNTSAGTDFSRTWSCCSGLTSFPLLNTSAGTTFDSAWSYCSGLTSFPTLDLHNLTNGGWCFYGVILNPIDYSNLLKAMAVQNLNTGVPFDGGCSHYTSDASSARNATLIGSRGWTITDFGLPSAAFPVITSPLTSHAETNSAWSYQVTATNGPSTFAAIGLPWGVAINSATGLISGTATGPTFAVVVIEASNTAGSDSAMLLLAFNEPGAPVITSPTSSSGNPSHPFSYTITASNSPATFAAIGLPSWLTVSATSGIISGSTATAGSWTVTLEAFNVHGAGLAPLTITIADPAPNAGSGTSSAGGGCGGGAAGLLFTLGVLWCINVTLGRRRPFNQ
jgi:hypothetical protein